MRKFIIGAAIAPLLATGAIAENLEHGAQVYKKCVTCHMIGPDAKPRVGPVLNGLDGRKSGTYEGFNYTDANKNSGITWNEESFKKYIRDPKGVIPGTKMAFAGLKDDEDVNDIWAFIKQFKADGSK